MHNMYICITVRIMFVARSADKNISFNGFFMIDLYFPMHSFDIFNIQTFEFLRSNSYFKVRRKTVAVEPYMIPHSRMQTSFINIVTST